MEARKARACLRKLRRPAGVALATVASSSVRNAVECFCFRYKALSFGFMARAADTGCSAARPCSRDNLSNQTILDGRADVSLWAADCVLTEPLIPGK